MIRLDEVVLPPALKIAKAWSPVAQNQHYAGDGTLILQQQIKHGGRAITLSSEKVGPGVLATATYSLVQLLESMLTPGRIMDLDLHNEGFTVTWDFGNLPLEYDLLGFRRPPQSSDRCSLTLRLLTLP